MADYSINNIYSGGYSGLDSNKNYGTLFSGYNVSAQGMGMSTDARTANILKEVSKNLSAGGTTIEVTQVSPQVFDAIPKQQLEEVRRLAKLLNVDVSLHAPIVDASGINEQQHFTETSREQAEKVMINAIERAHELNPDGNIPVTFHSSANLPGAEIIKNKNGKIEIKEAFVVDTEKGGIGKLPLRERHFGEINQNNLKAPDLKTEIKDLNEDQWGQKLRNLNYYAKLGIESIDSSVYQKTTSEIKEKEGGELTPLESRSKFEFDRGINFLTESYRDLKGLFETAYRHGTNDDKKLLDELNKNIANDFKEIEKEKDREKSAQIMKKVVEEGLKTLEKVSAPEIYKPLDDFARERSVDTFSNVALESYKKFKNSSPIISVENPPAGMGFSTGEDLKKIVEKSREKFVEKAVAQGILSESQAKKEAEKLIGVTWDVGHINMLRKKGWEAEDIIKETEKVAPLVKHVHLSDNFGLEHTELPMGMGNVPIKEIMQKLGKEGYKGKKIIEAMSWWQHFSEQGKAPPFQPSLEAMGSPIFSGVASPYWNQTGSFYEGYSGGFGMMLPQINYQTFGAGFSRLPSELGGQIPGAQGSRVSGNPME